MEHPKKHCFLAFNTNSPLIGGNNSAREQRLKLDFSTSTTTILFTFWACLYRSCACAPGVSLQRICGASGIRHNIRCCRDWLRQLHIATFSSCPNCCGISEAEFFSNLLWRSAAANISLASCLLPLRLTNPFWRSERWGGKPTAVGSARQEIVTDIPLCSWMCASSYVASPSS
ncbi:hypothetical protein B0H16DRAFT_1543764 [Mycena metata]|uniref:Uncharacterized protein n=1 Tax=Mycena metata TaxID=1033252 RepID=A0AAD7IZQ9_9AGAR|nr:hypothetical protein B0H16DRAFT_1543764 [Mycena metata]